MKKNIKNKLVVFTILLLYLFPFIVLSLFVVPKLDPVFLFADGPAPHLELIDQKEIIDLLVNYVHQRQCVVLPTNHNTDLTEKTADRTFIGSVTAEIEKGFFEVNTN